MFLLLGHLSLFLLVSGTLSGDEDLHTRRTGRRLSGFKTVHEKAPVAQGFDLDPAEGPIHKGHNLKGKTVAEATTKPDSSKGNMPSNVWFLFNEI